MMSPVRFTCFLASAFCGAMLCGCFSTSQTAMDEEKEPHFLAGRGRVNAMDYQGAIESFNEALEVNPHSASAHRELGWLFEQKDLDAASAIYHYQRYLQLRPGAVDSITITQRVTGLKQVLAQTVLPVPTTPGVQRELNQLREENQKLREELEKTKTTLATTLSNRVVQPSPVMRQSPVTRTPTQVTQVTTQISNNRPDTVRQVSDSRAVCKTHKVQSGESPAAIARRYGVRLEALLSANPGVNPKRLQIGQTLNLPAS